MNHADCHFKFQNQSLDEKVIRGQSEDSFTLQVITKAFPIVLTFDIKWLMYVERIV